MARAETTDKSNLILPIAIVVGLIPLLGGLIWYLNRPVERREPAAITAEAKAYTRNLKLSGVDMKATASYTGATLVEVVGNITNNGDRALSRVELTCVFYDPYGQVVFRERVPIVRREMKPGETRAFRLPFEGIPASWNQSLPQLVIASIEFA